MKTKDSILILGDINNNNINNIIYEILTLNNKGIDKPIKMIINSPGGDTLCGLALIDVMNNSQIPIHTICYGQALSMAFPILISGHKRFASKNSFIMYHELWYSLKNQTLTNHINETKAGKDIMDIIHNIIISKTKITYEQLKEKQNKDWYINSKQALKLGIIDKII